jgi:hypothetical protein
MLRRPLPKARARRKARRLHSYFVASTLPIGPAGPMHVLDRVSRATQAKIMLLAFEQSQLDLNGLDVINATRLIGQQDQIIIAGLCRGIDTSEAEKKAGEMRLVLEGMKAQGRKLRQKLNLPEVVTSFTSIPVLFPNWLATLRSETVDAELSIAGQSAQIVIDMRNGLDTREAEKVVERDSAILEDKKRVCNSGASR